MNKLSINKIFFLGIGGIGMSAIARYFLDMGKSVAGYDKTPSPITDKLIEEGAEIIFTDNPSYLPEKFVDELSDVLVVRTPAVPADSSLYSFFVSEEYQVVKRSEVLGWICDGLPTIAIAGTHGKTTTSSLIAHLLRVAEIPFSAFLGGIANNFKSNYVADKSAQYFVAEADEFDRSFLTLHPQIAVITSVDSDHLDIYGNDEEFAKGFRSFIGNIKEQGRLIIHKEAYEKLGLNAPALTYCISCDAMVSAYEVQASDGLFQFMVSHGKKEHQFALALPGLHNVENALAVYAVGKQLNLSDELINKAFMSFEGVERRFHYHLRSKNLVYIDDYAHHPSEINAVSRSLRMMYPDKKLTVLFQPHLFSRTRDFIDAFAKALGEFDEVLLLDIYPARELPIEGIDSAALLKKIQNGHKYLVQADEVCERLKNSELEIFVSLGAGDIDRLVQSIKTTLEQKLNEG